MNRESIDAFNFAKTALYTLAKTLQASSDSDAEAEVVTKVKAMWADLDWEIKEAEKRELFKTLFEPLIIGDMISFTSVI